MEQTRQQPILSRFICLMSGTGKVSAGFKALLFFFTCLTQIAPERTIDAFPDGIAWDIGFLGEFADIQFPFHRTCNGCEIISRFLKIRAALFGRTEVIFGTNHAHLVLGDTACTFNQHLEPLSTELADKLVRVFCTLHIKNPCLQSGFLQQPDRTIGSGSAGAVGIVCNDDFLCVIAHQSCLFRGQRGSQRGDDVIKSRLVHRDDVHIPFRQNQPSILHIFCKIEGEQVAALFKDRGIRRVQVFRLAVIQYPSAEPDDIFSYIDNREHHPVPENVIDRFAVSASGDDRRQQHIFIRKTLTAKKPPKVVPTGRCISQPIPCNRFGRETAFTHQVFPTGSASLGFQLVMVKMCSSAVDFKNQRLDFQRRVIPCLLRERDTGAFSQKPERVHIPEVFNPHNKGNHIAAGAATEAIKRLGIMVDKKGRCLFRMKRTQPLARPAGAAERNIPGHDGFNITAHFQLVKKTLWNCHYQAPFPTNGYPEKILYIIIPLKCEKPSFFPQFFYEKQGLNEEFTFYPHLFFSQAISQNRSSTSSGTI